MAIYRRSSRRPLVLVAVIAAVAGLVLGYVGGRATAPDLASQVQAARADAVPLLASLEVIRTEYPKLLNAVAGADPGGAESALARARSSFAARQATWALIDPAGTTALGTALDALGTQITQRAPEAAVDAAIDTATAAAHRIAGTPTA
jgi:hypothetical protein